MTPSHTLGHTGDKCSDFMAKNLHKYIAKELVKNVGTPLTTVSAKLAWLLRVHHLTDFDNGVKEKEKKREEKEEEKKLPNAYKDSTYTIMPPPSLIC